MSLLVCTRTSVAFGAEVVLHGVDLRIEARDRLAVVGSNGSGKSTLLRVLAGDLEPSGGELERQRGLRIGHLPQEAPDPVADTVLGEVLASRTDLVTLHRQMSDWERRMAVPGADIDDVLQRYGDAQHRYQDAGGYELESLAREALGGLGLGDVGGRHPAALSGGQKRRVELAKLLVQDADLLLIDEPTNHLDLAAIEWLEEFMAQVGVAFVLVSHDRRFLDRVCTGVLELDFGISEEYPGNYSNYVRLRGARRVRRQKEYQTQQEHISHQQDFIRRYRAGQRAKEARGRQTMLDRLPRLPAPPRDRRMRLRFAAAPMPRVLLKTSGEIDVGRDHRVLVTTGRITIAPGDRIAIVGPNGTGKSTLLHTLAGELAPLRGKVGGGPGVRRRLYRQDLGSPQPERGGDRTVLEDLLREHPIGADRGRNMLGALLFRGDDVHKHISDLSGGERARLLLGKVALEETNLLLLDEPTNHLDVSACEALEAALLRYPGGIVLVTHDRALIDAVATESWGLEDDGTGRVRIRRVLGGYSDLVSDRQRDRPAVPVSPAPRPGVVAPPKAARKEVAKGDVRRLEAGIAEIEAELGEVSRRLLDPATFADRELGAEVGRQHDRLSGALAELYERWGEIADRI